VGGELAQEIGLGRMPFRKAIDYFQEKQPLPSQAYTDLVHAMHDRAFVIAGVTRQDVLTDVQGLVLTALKEGTPLAQFQKDFQRVIEGKWDPRQGAAWRSRLIYETNVRTAYSAGRYRQLMSMRDTHPYWTYHHGDSRRPRLMHLGWNGITLRWDDPWIQTHYTPNGWGCSCYWTATDGVDLESMGKTGPDQAPPENLREVRYGDRTIQVPAGVDPGWGYAPGGNWSKWPVDAQIKAEGGGWQPLTPGTWESHERPQGLPVDEAKGRLSPKVKDPERAVSALKQILGADQKVFRVGTGDWAIPLVADAQQLAENLPADQARSLGLLPDLLRDPFEVWTGFLEDERTGQVILQHRLLKAVDAGGKKLILTARGSSKGVLEAWECLPMAEAARANHLRWGILVYGR
jgi:hypothetical protein